MRGNEQQRAEGKKNSETLVWNATVYVFSFHIAGTKFKPRWATPHPDCPSWPNVQVSPVCFLRTKKDTAWWCGHKLFREETSLSTFQLWRKPGFISKSHRKRIIVQLQIPSDRASDSCSERWVLASPSFSSELTQRSRKLQTGPYGLE